MCNEPLHPKILYIKHIVFFHLERNELYGTIRREIIRLINKFDLLPIILEVLVVKENYQIDFNQLSDMMVKFKIKMSEKLLIAMLDYGLYHPRGMKMLSRSKLVEIDCYYYIGKRISTYFDYRIDPFESIESDVLDDLDDFIEYNDKNFRSIYNIFTQKTILLRDFQTMSMINFNYRTLLLKNTCACILLSGNKFLIHKLILVVGINKVIKLDISTQNPRTLNIIKHRRRELLTKFAIFIINTQRKFKSWYYAPDIGLGYIKCKKDYMDHKNM